MRPQQQHRFLPSVEMAGRWLQNRSTKFETKRCYERNLIDRCFCTTTDVEPDVSSNAGMVSDDLAGETLSSESETYAIVRLNPLVLPLHVP